MNDYENEILAEIKVNAGYFDSDLLAAPVGSMAPGSKNVILTDDRNQRVFRGLLASGTGGRTMFNVAGGYASLNDDGAAQGIGSVFNFINESLFTVGAGKLFYNGADTGISASSALQLAPKQTGHSYPTWFTAGFDQPDAPIVVAMAPSDSHTGLLTGLFSLKIARVRSLTGARSIASVTSAVVRCDGQTIRATFGAASSNGQDRWALFGTKAGFGGTGVHYLIQEIAESDLGTIDGVARSFEVEYNDADLLPIIAYIDDYPPQAALFGARLENYVLLLGCYDNAIASSIRNFPESFNPDHLGFLPKTPTAVLADPQGTCLYVSTDASVHCVSVIPSTDNPQVVQTIWSNVGVANSHNWCAVGGVIFAFTAKARAVTMNVMGQPTQEFALPVAKAMRDWDIDSTVVFEAPHLNSVVFANNGDAFIYNIQTGYWSSPAKYGDFADGTIVSAVVRDRLPYITLLNGTDFNAYEFDNGNSEVTAVIRTPPMIAVEGYRHNILGMLGRLFVPETGTYTLELLNNYDDTVLKTISHFTMFSGMQTTVQSRWFLPRLDAFSVRWTGTQSDFSADMFLSKIFVYGTLETSKVLTRTVSTDLTDDAGAIVSS